MKIESTDFNAKISEEATDSLRHEVSKKNYSVGGESSMAGMMTRQTTNFKRPSPPGNTKNPSPEIVE